VSYKFILSARNGPIFWKPIALNTPPPQPISIAPQGVVTKSEADPIATPPASVALSMTSISSLPKRALAENAAPRQLPLIASTVFTMTLYY